MKSTISLEKLEKHETIVKNQKFKKSFKTGKNTIKHGNGVALIISSKKKLFQHYNKSLYNLQCSSSNPMKL